MKYKVNDKIDNVDVYKINENGPEKVKFLNVIEDKTVLLIGVPGAFTPTCSEEHLPGYVKLSDDFLSKGIQKIIFISVNDPFVLEKWLDANDAKNIDFLSDYDHNFLEKSGFEIDLSVVGLGIRLSRFAMVIKNSVITHIFDENGAGLLNSKAEKVISKL